MGANHIGFLGDNGVGSVISLIIEKPRPLTGPGGSTNSLTSFLDSQYSPPVKFKNDLGVVAFGLYCHVGHIILAAFDANGDFGPAGTWYPQITFSSQLGNSVTVPNAFRFNSSTPASGVSTGKGTSLWLDADYTVGLWANNSRAATWDTDGFHVESGKTLDVGGDPVLRKSQLVGGRSSRGAGFLSLPGVVATGSVTAQALSANTRYYYRFFVTGTVTVDQVVFEVTTGATGNARVGVIAANADWQPTGPVLFDSGNISVATTGVKVASTSITLTQGRYLALLHMDAAITVREIHGCLFTGMDVVSSVGGTPIVQRRARSLTYGPLDATPWDSEATGNVERYGVFLRISNPNA